MYASWSVLLTRYYFGDQIKKNEIGGACSTIWERRGSYRWGNLKERGHLEDLGMGGRMGGWY
jgi:hypothetical protein